ncbi:polyphosphate kinase 2 [Roseiconus nitratireducens]|uniref:ADP/GDP-polyphosphate phosphotransferase n=1 Tax=Roseiconus nitratireducens TaxID=2605748 RepID=A0A5M6DG09_9BACT|nr:polyphosphate kinase 2 [Roseiconus nitratireducens]KAA5545232.1 polyphosphate kinase 2 [Roseiconus nitratireducens]
MSKKADKKKRKKHQASKARGDAEEPAKLGSKEYAKQLELLQVELVRLQEWVKHTGARIVVVFEGRDAAGKGGVIKRITERVSPRVFRVVALPAPSDRERSQLYVQRYVQHLPAAGEIILFDRSWYNRAGVEKVLGFCTDREHEKFLRNCDRFEAALIDDGILLLKYWLSVGAEEQERRFRARIEDPLRQWKLSPTDLESVRRWYEYSKARDAMFVASDTDTAPWYIVRSDDKRRARLNCIRHLLSRIPYEEVPHEKVEIPDRDLTHAYDDVATLATRRFVPEHY